VDFDNFNASALHQAFEREFDQIHVQQVWRHAVADERPAKKRALYSQCHETTLSLLTLQRSLCRMLRSRQQVRRTRTQLSASSWNIQLGRDEHYSNDIVEQWCADCASEAGHCQKAGPKKTRMHLISQPAITLPFLSQLALFSNGPPFRGSAIPIVRHSGDPPFRVLK